MPDKLPDTPPLLRFAGAAALGAVALVAIYAGGLVFQVTVVACACLAVVEWALMCTHGEVGPLVLAGPLVVLAAWAAALWSGVGDVALMVVLIGATLLSFIRMLLGVGVMFVGVGFVGLVALRSGAGGLGDALFLAFVVWGADLTSYAGRRLIVTAPLAPGFWPGLTWSSLAGGILGAAVTGAGVAATWGGDPFVLLRAASFAAIIGAMAQAGDTLEGSLSRRHGSEGVGSLLPGHDGLLDRVAGVLAAAPVVVLMRLTAHGVQMWQ